MKPQRTQRGIAATKMNLTTKNTKKETKLIVFAKSQNAPTPLMGKGWGEGANSNISNSYVTPSLNPLPPGEGKTDFLQSCQVCYMKTLLKKHDVVGL